MCTSCVVNFLVLPSQYCDAGAIVATFDGPSVDPFVGVHAHSYAAASQQQRGIQKAKVDEALEMLKSCCDIETESNNSGTATTVSSSKTGGGSKDSAGGDTKRARK